MARVGAWEGYVVSSVRRFEAGEQGPRPEVWIELRPRENRLHKCGGCGRKVRQVHDWHERWIRDLPIFDADTPAAGEPVPSGLPDLRPQGRGIGLAGPLDPGHQAPGGERGPAVKGGLDQARGGALQPALGRGEGRRQGDHGGRTVAGRVMQDVEWKIDDATYHRDKGTLILSELILTKKRGQGQGLQPACTRG